MRRERAKLMRSERPSGGPGRVGVAAMVAMAGLAHGQVIVPQQARQNVQIQVQPGNQFVNQNQLANQGPPLRKVFTDEAVGARESLVRVEELAGAGNLSEAARVLQQTLDREADQVLPHPDEFRMFETVRSAAARLLRSKPELLAKYREQHQARAQELLDAGDFATVERTYLMTPAGLEAALRLGQWQMERARFHAARMTLAQLDAHPDRSGPKAREAAEMLAKIGAYVDPGLIRSRLAKWNEGLSPEVTMAAPVVAPKEATPTARDQFEAGPTPSWDTIGDEPLQSIALTDAVRMADEGKELAEETEDVEEADAERAIGRMGARWAWVTPTLDGETLYVNDGDGIGAYDASTLAELWRSTQSRGPILRREQDMFWGQNSRSLEDVAGVLVARGLVVGTLGQAKNGGRDGDDRLYALDARTGETRWALDVSTLDPALDGASVRGTPVVEGDVLVVAARKSAQLRRVTALYLIGIDLATGELRWLRNVGSVGMQPWGRTQTRVDGMLLHEGVVYRGDDMGLIGAYEATTGRCLWLRHTLAIPEADWNAGFNNNQDGEPTFLVHTPVMMGGRLFFVEPFHGSVVQLDPESGRPQGRVDARATGAGVDYLVAVGDHLAMIGRSTISFTPAADFAPANVRVAKITSEELKVQASPTATGRAIAMRDGSGAAMLALPTEAGMLLLDPNGKQPPQIMPVANAGNALVTGTPEDPGALVIASPTRLHAYLSWERAETGLQRRAAMFPSDPAPTLTYLELALRMGKYELAPKLADQALVILRKPAEGIDANAGRSRLFTLLHTTMVRARMTLQRVEGGAGEASGIAPSSTQPDVANSDSPNPSKAGSKTLQDLTILSQIEQRLARTAETPVQRALALLERTHLRDLEQQPGPAVDALQEILLDDVLADAILPGSAAVTSTGDTISAGEVATDLLTDVVSRFGAASYEAFEQEATRQLEQLPAGASAKDAAGLARRYPLSGASAKAWQRASEAYLASGNDESSRRALRQGIASATRGVRIGREDAEAMLGELLGRLVPLTNTPGERQPLQRFLLGLAKRVPNMTLRDASGSQVRLVDAANRLGEADARRTVAVLGEKVTPQAQVIEGWNLLQNAAPELPGTSRDLVVMGSRRGDTVAGFGVSAVSGRLEQLWSRGVEMMPVVVRITPEATVLFWPQAGAAQLEAISNLDGATLWKSPALTSLPGWARPPESDAVAGGRPQRLDQLNTPLDGIVRGEDLLFSLDPRAIVICDRRGRCAAFDLTDGKTLWSGQTPVTSVYDLEVAGARGGADAAGAGRVLILGATGSNMETKAAAICIDVASGREAWRIDPNLLGRHARFGRFLRDGDALVATSDGLLRVKGEDGSQVWQASTMGVREAMGAWVVTGKDGGEAAFVLNGDFQLWRVDANDGAIGRQPVPTQDRVFLPFSASVVTDRLILSSSAGVAMVDGAGRLAGADALDNSGQVEPGIVIDGQVVVLETGEREQLETGETMNATRVLRFETGSSKLVSEDKLVLFQAPDSVGVLDGKILIGQGPFTLVFDVR
jgi:outer membrane protein assembly factor BamB